MWDTVKVVLQALLIAFVIRTFFFQPFNIPSGSMIPTLLVGDYLFVNKLSYGYSKHSFDFTVSLFGSELFRFGPVPIRGRVFAVPVRRGDVVVFKLPTDDRVDYIKRVIGLPGDRIQVREGVLYINDRPVKRRRVDDYVVPDGPRAGTRVRRYRETLPNGRSYFVLDLYDGSIADNTDVYVVPPGHYFMMGDNRDNSTDSRFLEHVGYVPYENLVGRAVVIFFSHTPEASLWQPWMWPFVIRWSRLGKWVR
ncbi:MAG TPA: signal peptidase I [Thermopetrobacter sp.]|nr:signal peptidase I [Thermopetrobacter sp.]